MGYTTDFAGQFKLNKKMIDLPIFDKLHEWSEGVKKPLDGYCQWQLTEDRLGIEWDGNEKFYQYEEWLQIIIDQLLLPNTYSLTGEVEFQGEDTEDHGFLFIEENKVKTRKIKERYIECPECGHKIKLEKD
jgi:hypothetical protein